MPHEGTKGPTALPSHGRGRDSRSVGGRQLVPAAAQRGRRAAGVGDPAVAAAKDQHLDEPVEHDAVGDARAVAAQRVGVVVWGQQGGELVPQGVEDAGWQGRHG